VVGHGVAPWVGATLYTGRECRLNGQM